MAIIEVNCPACGKTLQFEDTKEKGFCEFCGEQILLKDSAAAPSPAADAPACAAPAEPACSAPAYSAPEPSDKLAAAKTAFSRGDYNTAKAGFEKALSGGERTWDAVFYNALCEAYVSDPLKAPFQDVFNAAGDASAMIKAENPGADDRKASIFFDAFDFIKQFYYKNCTPDKGYVFPSAEAAGAHYTNLERLAALTLYILDIADDATTAANPRLEDTKKQAINLALEICSAAKKNITYLVGYEVIKDKSGIAATQPVNRKLSPLFDEQAEAYEKSLKDKYNTLPGTTAALKNFDERIAAREGEINDFEDALKRFFLVNPEDEKKYRKPGLFGAKKKKEEVESKFSEELLRQKDLAEAAKEDLKELQKSKKQFIADNIKR